MEFGIFYLFDSREYGCEIFKWNITHFGSSMFQNLPTISKWLIHVSKLAYDFKIIGTMTKLRQVSEPIFAARNFMHRRQVDIIPYKQELFIWLCLRDLHKHQKCYLQNHLFESTSLFSIFTSNNLLHLTWMFLIVEFKGTEEKSKKWSKDKESHMITSEQISKIVLISPL